MMMQEQKSGAAVGWQVVSVVPDPATFNGLLLVDATLNYPGFTFTVTIFAIWHGEAIKIEQFEDETQARTWLADAVRLVEWKQSGLDADPSGLYWKQAGVPAWVKSWKQREDRACKEATNEDDACLFPRPGTDEESSGVAVSSRSDASVTSSNHPSSECEYFIIDEPCFVEGTLRNVPLC